jgi:hypothetical protein
MLIWVLKISVNYDYYQSDMIVRKKSKKAKKQNRDIIVRNNKDLI